MSLVELWLRAGGQRSQGVACVLVGWLGIQSVSGASLWPRTPRSPLPARSHWPCSQGTCCGCQNQLQTVSLSQASLCQLVLSPRFHFISLYQDLSLHCWDRGEVLAYSSVGKIGEGSGQELESCVLVVLSFSGLLGMYLKERKSIPWKNLHPNMYWNIIYNIQYMKTVCLSKDEGIKEMCYIHIQWILFIHNNAGNPAENRDEFRGHYAKWNWQDRERQMLYDLTYVCIVKKKKLNSERVEWWLSE